MYILNNVIENTWAYINVNHRRSNFSLSVSRRSLCAYGKHLLWMSDVSYLRKSINMKSE
jgi:hypothetical protein